ncbi:MAG: hypothetical protein PVH19_11065 [Planctomycetia bacterium]|jgi:uncharacterized protein involved in exopolysaccharide biosynthesis
MNTDTKKQEPLSGGLLYQWTRVLIQYAAVWLIPTIVISVLAAGYAFFRSNTWQVTQAMIVRNEAIGTEDATGRFSHTDQMKTVEETILEVLYSREVLRKTLKTVGPGPKFSGNPKNWPTDRDIEDFRSAIGLEAPEGAEFGTTEILYLLVKTKDPEYGVKLTGEMFKQLENQLLKVRNAKAQSVVAELVLAAKLARKNLGESTQKLANIEKEVGADLSELRMMNHVGGNESTLQRTIGAIRGELRNAKIKLEENQNLIALLEDAENDTDRLLATPNRLLESQPSLRALKNGLIATQLKTDELQGRMLDSHPEVEAALEAERTTRDSLHREVKTAILGLKNDIIHEKNRIRLLETQRNENVARLEKLATIRATYENLVQENEHRSELLQKADERLAQVRAHQENTLSINLIEPIGSPESGARPLGPSRSMILLVGVVGGLFVGFGLLLLVVPVDRLKACVQTTPTSTVIPTNDTPEPNLQKEVEVKEEPEDELEDIDLIDSRLKEVAELARVRTHRELQPEKHR